MSATDGGNPGEGAHGGPTPRRRGARRSAADGAAELQRALAEKDRQLRDLTEQALDFLERLAEAQRKDQEHARTSRRAEELTRLLEDARRRLRTAGGVVLRAGAPAPAPALEVVLCGEAADVTDAVQSLPEDAAVTWVGPPDGVPPTAGAGDRVQWIAAADTRTPAQRWNLAMAVTRADAVLFLGPGARLQGDLALAPRAGDPSVALLAPRISRNATAALGQDEANDLDRFVPLPVPEGEGTVQVPYADPAAFVLRRAAFEVIGLFDEALLGEMALADYALRARARGFRALGAPELALEIPPGRRDPHAAQDRLLVLAAHRPEALGGALAEGSALWDLEQPGVEPFLTRLFVRLPDPAAQRSLLGHIAGRMVAEAAPASRVADDLRRLQAEQLRRLADHPLAAGGELGGLAERLARAESLPAAIAALQALFDAERRLLDTGARREAERDAALRTLTEARAERDAARAEGQALRQGLAAIGQAIDLMGDPRPAHIRERLLELRTAAQNLDQVLKAAGARDAAELIQELHGIRAEYARVREALVEREERLADLDRELAGRKSELAAQAAQLEEASRALADHRRLLAERNGWIAALLREVTRRRLRGRTLQEHERRFLEGVDGAQ